LRTNDEKVRLKIRLDDTEKAKLEHEAALCGLTRSEYLRQLCLGRQPHPKQPPEFWDLLDALYEVHAQLERLAARCPEASGECSQLERLVLFLQGVA
jgi:uncharacterized protein (DUF1778 family)